MRTSHPGFRKMTDCNINIKFFVKVSLKSATNKSDTSFDYIFSKRRPLWLLSFKQPTL